MPGRALEEVEQMGAGGRKCNRTGISRASSVTAMSHS